MKKVLTAIALLVCVTSSQSLADNLRDCNGVTPMTKWRNCMASNIGKLTAAIDNKVFEACKKKVAAGGSEGPAAIDERLICRVQKLSQILDGIN